MRLRHYQVECVRRIFKTWLMARSVLAVLATGAGKTVIFAEVARRVPGRVLVIAHREELVEQAAKKLEAVCRERVDIEMADRRAARGAMAARLVVASVQTLSSPARRERFACDYFAAVVVDEAHHAPAASYRAVLGHFEAAKVLGVTATPKRKDELALGQVFDQVAFDYGIGPAIEDGFLVPVSQQAVKVDGLDFSGVKKAVSGDLSESDLESILNVEKVLHAMAVPTLEVVGDRPALVFCASVAHAERMAEVLCRYKRGCARALSGATDKGTRRSVVADYQAGRVQILCNCSLFLEGFDAPHTACVVMGRPTNSLALYCQILGRATRPLEGVVDRLPEGALPNAYLGMLQACADNPDDDSAAAALADWVADHGAQVAAVRRAAIAASDKPSCLVMDFVGNSGKHKLVSAADVLGGKYGVQVRDYARQTQEQEGQAQPVEESLHRANVELALIEAIREEDEARRVRAAVKAREASYQAVEVSPFCDGGPHMAGGDAAPQDDAATEKQALLLHRRYGWSLDKARALRKKQASVIISRYKAAEEAGVARPAG